MAGSRKSRRAIVNSERFAAEVEELMTIARERGQVSRRQRRREAPHDRGDRATGTQDVLRDELRRLLEDEVVPAYPEDASFVESEFHREVVKKALVGLHAETLRRVAEKHLIDKRGSTEDVAARIASAYRYDDRQIAQLILDNEDEPEPDRGHVSRVFPMAHAVDVAGALPRIKRVAGRLVRTGVARWLEVDEFSASDDLMKAAINARLRTYRAFVDDLGEEPTLGSSPTEKEVTLVLEDGKQSIVATGADANVSRTATRGLAAVIKTPFAAGLPLSGRPRSGNLATFDDRTVALLDLVYSRLDRIGVTDRNLTVARFLTEKGDEAGTARPEEAGEHSLKAVRFEGHHLFDSPQACQLIASGRGLIDISLWVAAPELAADGGETPWFPVRCTIERDHVGVVTGFGRHRAERSLVLHRMLLEQLEAAISTGPVDLEELEELSTRIRRVAKSGRPGSGTLRRSAP
jgi:hypothetical protein